MLTSLRKFLTPPVFEADEEKTRIAGLLNTVLLFLFLTPMILIVNAIFIPANRPLALPILAILTGALVAMVFFMRRGHVQGVSVVAATFLLALIGLFGYLNGGEPRPVNIYYTLVIVIAGLLLGGRGAIGFGVASAVMIGIVTYGGTLGLFSARLQAPPPAIALLTYAVGFILIGVVLRLASNSIGVALARARAGERNVADRNRELQALSASLEQRVEERTHELVQAQAHTQTLLAELAEASRIAALASFELDVNIQTLIFSDQFYELLGTTAEAEGGYRKPMAEAIYRFIHPDDAARVLPEVQGLVAARGASVRQLEYRLIRRDGATRSFAFRFDVTRAADGTALQVRGAAQDITERKRFEADLARRANELTILSESARTVSSTLDVQEVVNRLLQQLPRLMDFHTASIQLVNQKGERQQIGGVSLDAGRQTSLQTPADYFLRPVAEDPLIAAVVRGRAPVIISQTHTDPRWEVLPETQHIQAWLAAPLLVGQEVVGLLIMDHTQPGAYTAETTPLINAFTAQAAIALQNARVFDEAQKRAAELETVTQLSTAITTIQNPQEMLQTVVDLVKPSFNLYHAHIYLLDEAGDQLTLTAGAGVVGYQMANEKRSIPLNREHSLVARAARTRRAIIANDVSKEPDFLPNPLLPDTQSELAVPLTVGAQLLGVLDVQADRVDHFTAADARIQTILAAQIATALQNARSFARSEQSLKDLDALTRRLTREGWEGYLDQVTAGRLGYLYDSGELLSLTDGQHSVTEAEPSLVRPVVSHGETIGRLVAEGAETADEDTHLILDAIAQGLSTHIDNLRLTEQTQKALAEQVRLAAEMDNQRNTLEAVLLNIPAGVFVAEAPTGKHILSNPRAQSMLGRGIAAEANVESLAEVYPVFRADTEETYPAAERPLVRGMFGETARVDDMEIHRPDGSRAWLEVVGAPIRDARGRITASVAVFQDITERRQADAEIRRRNEELGALNRVGSVLTSSFNLRTILQATAREIATILGARSTSIALLDSSQQNLSVVADYSAVPDIPSVLGLTLRLTEAPSSYRVFETKRAVVVDNAQTNPLVADIHELMRARRTQNLMIVPLLARGDVIGTITVETGQVSQTFTAQEMALVETVAGQIASAVENIRLFEDAQRRARELEAVAEVGTAASTILDPQALLQTVVDQTKASFSLYHAHIYMLNDLGDTLVLTAGAGLVGEGMVTEGRRISLGAEQSLVARAARTRRGVVVHDVRADPTFLPHALLPETRSELAVPLIAGDKVLGVFDVQSEIPSRFTEEDVRIQTTLANQVAVALQNAATFAQVVEARSQIEAQARRLTREGWADFLNAIDHREQMGYLYDQTRVTPLTESAVERTNGHGLSVPIIVTGELVGSVNVEGTAEHVWDETEKSIAVLVAQRLSQQVENLRLLDQAQRYRAEAENAIRRLTREGWQSYEVAESAFVYDQSQVVPLLPDGNAHEPTRLAQPITVRGETIGQVSVAGLDSVSAQQAELVALVSQRLSGHIENLRLFDQTQSALSTTQSLYQISSRIALAGDLQEVLAAVGEGLPVLGINRLVLFTHELDERGELEAAMVAANWHSGVGTPPTPVGQRYPRAVFNTFRLMLSPTAIFFNDLQTDPRTDANSLGIAQQLNIRAVVSLPLRAGVRQVGSLLLEGEEAHEFSDSEIQPFLSVAETVAISLENRRLAEETQAALAETEDQAHRLARLNELGEELSRANTLDDILQAVTVKASEIIQADRTTILLLNATGDYFQVVTLSGEAVVPLSGTAGSAPAPTLYPLAGTTAELAVKQRRLVVVTDPALNVLPEMKRFVEQGFRTFMNVPLIAGGKVIGTLNVSSKQPSVYGRRDETLMLQVASLLAASLESLRLLEQTQKRAAELETVAKVSATASAILDSEQLLQMVVDLTKGSFGLYHTHAYMLDEAGETLVLTAGAGLIGSQMVAEGRSIPVSWEQSLVARAARTRQAVVANDVRADPDFLPHPLLPDTRAELAVPMIVGDTVLGVFDVQANTVNYFTDEDVRIQNTLAAQIAVALNNANLYADQSATVARLRELDHLKSSFLANMSHELRTPLNSILGFTEVILEELDGPLTEQMENDLRIVYKNGQHLLHLINDVLDMAKIESGKLTLHPERVDLTEILEEVIGLTSPLASTKDIELRLDAEFGTLEAEVDRIRIRQVMINIINNAIKFTEHGHIDIRAVPQNDVIRVTVKDTGLGIPPDHLESVFQEFTQVDTTTTRKAGGTGLGLPISRHLVQMHGGKLWAESTGLAGEGSTFIVELPVKAAYEAPTED